MEEILLCEQRDNLALVTLNRPSVLNALNGELRRAIAKTMATLNRDDKVRAIVITGAGERAFCAGLDLKEARLVPEALRETQSREVVAVYQAIRLLDKPIIAALNGVGAGAGFQISLVSDVRVAHPLVRLGQPEINAGLASIMGSYLMTLHLGLSRNAELSLTGRLMDAKECHQLGLLNHLVPREEVLPRALAIASELAQKPPLAMRITKRHFRKLTQPGFDAAAAESVAAQHEAYAAGEAQQAMAVFAQKGNRE